MGVHERPLHPEIHRNEHLAENPTLGCMSRYERLPEARLPAGGAAATEPRRRASGPPGLASRRGAPEAELPVR